MSPLGLPTSQEKGLTETLSLGHAPNEPTNKTKRDPKYKPSIKLASHPKPKIPNGFLMTKHHFPIILIKISSKPNKKTSIYPRFGYESGRTNKIRGHSPSIKLQNLISSKTQKEKITKVVLTW